MAITRGAFPSRDNVVPSSLLYISLFQVITLTESFLQSSKLWTRTAKYIFKLMKAVSDKEDVICLEWHVGHLKRGNSSSFTLLVFVSLLTMGEIM